MTRHRMEQEERALRTITVKALMEGKRMIVCGTYHLD